MTLTTVAFDADDTLWENETFFRDIEARFLDLMAPHVPGTDLGARLLAAERRNLGRYGFGIKGFLLSMIETAVEASEGRVPGTTVGAIIALGHEMLAHPVRLLPHARAAVVACAARWRVILVTKGDLLDQERKLAASGLGPLFAAVEIVSDKTPETYTRAFDRHGDGAARAAMVGNSLASDVLPALAAGAWAVHVPAATEWALDRAEPGPPHPRGLFAADLGAVPELLFGIA